MNIDMLLEVNLKLLYELEQGLAKYKLSYNIASAFSKMEPFFRLYTGEYCRNK